MQPGFHSSCRAALRWVTFLAAAGWWIVAVASGGPVLGVPLVLAAAALGVGWLLVRGLWPTALVLALVALPIAWQQAGTLPRAAAALQADSGGGYVRITGTVRGWTEETVVGQRGHAVLLGDVSLEHGGRTWALPEARVRHSARWLPWQSYRRVIRVGGYALESARRDGRLELTLAEAETHLVSEPLPAGGREWLRQALADRAGYYLSNRAHALYEPILLGIRDRESPEARAVASAFRRVGVAHLFAISGLHVGLLFLLFMGVLHLAGAPLRRGQGTVHGRQVMRLAVTGLVWAYVALIGFPVPAVRAALMGTVVIWSGLLGTRSPAPYVLALTALVLLALDPSQVHDISFQLSFLAYLFVVAALLLWERRPHREVPPRWWHRLADGAALNLLVTLSITVGLWPVMAATFGRVSLLVFAGNLLMVPLLSALVLPSGLLALAVSALHLGTVPGGWLERAVFGWLEWVLGAWAWIAEAIDRVGPALVLHPELDWGPPAFVAYYLAVGAAWWAVHRLLPRARPEAPRAAPEPVAGAGR